MFLSYVDTYVEDFFLSFGLVPYSAPLIFLKILNAIIVTF